MKSPFVILLLAGLATPLVFSGCKRVQPVDYSKLAPTGQRLIRVSFRGQHGTFRFRINQCPIEKLRNTEFTNVMTRLQLAYGDIVIWEGQPTKTGVELAHPDEIPHWWFEYLKDVRASCYIIRSDDISDFFTTPIYHWKAPREKPRPLEDAMFFVDGVAVGQGARGFQTMVDTIQRTKSGSVFILAPRIRNEGQASPWIAEDQLSDWAQNAGVSSQFEKILTSRYGGLLDLARFGDGDD